MPRPTKPAGASSGAVCQPGGLLSAPRPSARPAASYMVSELDSAADAPQGVAIPEVVRYI
jgi:hypothetical protein